MVRPTTIPDAALCVDTEFWDVVVASHDTPGDDLRAMDRNRTGARSGILEPYAFRLIQ